MALLFTEGFDYWNPNNGIVGMKWAGQAQLTYLNMDTGRNGGSSLKLTSAGATLYAEFTPTGTIIVGFAFYLGHVYTGIYIFSIGDGTVVHINLNLDSNRKIQVLHGGSGAVIGQGVSELATSQWHYIQIKLTVADVGGYCELRIGEQLQFTYTGDTRNGGTAYSSRIYPRNTGGGSYTHHYDDMYVIDTTGPAPLNDFLGDVRIDTIRPSGAGSSTQWTPSAGSNYQNVDETTLNRDTDYISSSVNGNKDLFAMGNVPVGATGAIFAICVHSVAIKVGAEVSGIKNVIKTTGGEYLGAAWDPSVANYQDCFTFWTTNPETGIAWVKSEIDSLEAGILNVS